jgi:hypothetical protein
VYVSATVVVVLEGVVVVREPSLEPEEHEASRPATASAAMVGPRVESTVRA